jgi:hypothetical protein
VPGRPAKKESRAIQDLIDDYRQSRVVNLFDSSAATKKKTQRAISKDKKIPHAKNENEMMTKKKQMLADQGRISCVKFIIYPKFSRVLFYFCDAL